MKYFTDKPIENNSDDLLGRASFSERVGEAIYNFDAEDGLVIGLYGSWGSGKTSVVNMIVNHIEEKSTDNKPLIIKFEPWNYLDRDNLISIFFRNLKEHIEIEGNKELKKREVAEKLKDYADAFDAASIIPVIGPGLAALLKSVAKVQGENLSKVPSLEETKKKVEQALSELDNKIIVVIDDIDRLTNSQIRDIFQLVKQLGDFPNIVYVLVMEREVVARALNEVHNVDGNEYLEKIVQVPFEIPELNKQKVNRVFLNKLDTIIESINSEFVLDDGYWNAVFQYCISPYLENLRDVNRVINIFQFKYTDLYKETSFEDLIAITTIEVMKPDLYKWIFRNKTDICGEISSSHFIGGSTEKEDSRDYYSEFENLNVDPEMALDSVATLFPRFKQQVRKFRNYSNSNIRKNNRIAHTEKFDLYFSFNLEDVKVSRLEIEDIIYNKNIEDLSTSINNINENGDIRYLLDEIQVMVDDIPYNRLDLILYVLLKSMWKFNDENDKNIFYGSGSFQAESIANEILKRFKSEEERYDVIKESLLDIDSNGLGSIGMILNRIEGGLENKGNQILSIEKLDKLEDIYLSRLNELKNSDSVFSLKDFDSILYFWEKIDEKDITDYLNKKLTNNLTKLKFICALAGSWSGSYGEGRSFHESRYSKYTSKEEIYNLIKSLDKENLIEFSFEEQIKLVTFILIIENDREHITEKEAKEYLNNWNNNI